jgi:hypothetical protein
MEEAMHILPCLRLSFTLAAIAVSSATLGAVATFDDLSAPPALDARVSLQSTNNNSLDYAGVTWDAGFGVVGDQYKVNLNPDYPNPLFGIPHSGHYFVTNYQGGPVSIATNQILTGAWFGRNEYYGYGGGADQVTIVALSGQTTLMSAVFDLPENHLGQPEPLSFVDTGAFAGLSGITGYRIDRRAISDGHWVADDFAFAPVPIPAAVWLFASAVAGFVAWGRRRA